MKKVAIIGGMPSLASALASSSGVESMVIHPPPRLEDDNIAWPEYFDADKVTGKRRKWRGNNGAFGKCQAKRS